MRESVLEKLMMSTTNVENEFKKIKELLGYSDFYYRRSLVEFFEEEFSSFKEIRKYFSSYEDCENKIIPTLLEAYKHGNSAHQKDLDDKVLEEFLDFCEVHFYLIMETTKLNISNYKIDVLMHLKDLIETSLQKLCYKIIKSNNEFGFLIIKENPVIETIALASDNDTEKIIFDYLDYKNQDEYSKESILHKFIDKLENIMKEDNEQLVHSIREFAQIIRHPEQKKKEAKYKWFFDDCISNMDKLFLLCLYVQQRVVVKEILDEFCKEKKTANEKEKGKNI